MQDRLIDRVNTLIDTYDKLLREKGIVCTASRRYFETNVESRTMMHRDIISVLFDSWYYDREEKTKYRGLRNRHYAILLRFSPAEKGLLKREWCKEYVFTVKKIDRAFEGDAPIEYTFSENQVLTSIEKRIQHILKKAEHHAPTEVCRDTVWDALRYVSSRKYQYKKCILGKDRTFVELIVNGVFGAAALAILLVLAIRFY